VNYARRDLCGGCSALGIPTAIGPRGEQLNPSSREGRFLGVRPLSWPALEGGKPGTSAGKCSPTLHRASGSVSARAGAPHADSSPSAASSPCVPYGLTCRHRLTAIPISAIAVPFGVYRTSGFLVHRPRISTRFKFAMICSFYGGVLWLRLDHFGFQV